jgi:signal transduction histidine kinase
MKATNKIGAALAGAVLLIALEIALSVWAFRQIEHAIEARKHSYDVINCANDLLSALKDAETGQRGYLITGDEAFLQPYLAVRDGVIGHLEELRQLTLISAAHKHLDILAPLIHSKMAELSRVIELRRNHDMSAMLAAVSGGQGKQLMDSIRQEMGGFIQTEESVLAQLEAEFQSNMSRLFIFIISASLFTLLLAFSFAYLTYQGTQHSLGIQEGINKQLQSANQELEAFSYSVSHDLRAPLRAVNGFAGIVLEDFGPQLPEKARNHLERIRNGGERMGALIDDLLAFSRLSRQPVNRQSVNTAKLAQNAIDELKLQRDGRRIEIKTGELPACGGDPALLKQVWVNLISNAIKYTRGREPATVEIGCVLENNENVFFVRDNGAGFDMKYANKLFGVFQRLHRADEFEGTGVGLAIVQRIVHRHGGRVWAKAEVNRGATFYFTLEGETKL